MRSLQDICLLYSTFQCQEKSYFHLSLFTSSREGTGMKSRLNTSYWVLRSPILHTP